MICIFWDVSFLFYQLKSQKINFCFQNKAKLVLNKIFILFDNFGQYLCTLVSLMSHSKTQTTEEKMRLILFPDLKEVKEMEKNHEQVCTRHSNLNRLFFSLPPWISLQGRRLAILFRPGKVTEILRILLARFWTRKLLSYDVNVVWSCQKRFFFY